MLEHHHSLRTHNNQAKVPGHSSSPEDKHAVVDSENPVADAPEDLAGRVCYELEPLVLSWLQTLTYVISLHLECFRLATPTLPCTNMLEGRKKWRHWRAAKKPAWWRNLSFKTIHLKICCVCAGVCFLKMLTDEENQCCFCSGGNVYSWLTFIFTPADFIKHMPIHLEESCLCAVIQWAAFGIMLTINKHIIITRTGCGGLFSKLWCWFACQSEEVWGTVTFTPPLCELWPDVAPCSFAPLAYKFPRC